MTTLDFTDFFGNKTKIKQRQNMYTCTKLDYKTTQYSNIYTAIIVSFSMATNET